MTNAEIGLGSDKYSGITANEAVGIYTGQMESERYSNIILVGDLCKRQCDIKHAFSRRRRQSCKADCESRLGSAQRVEALITIVEEREKVVQPPVQVPTNGNGRSMVAKASIGTGTVLLILGVALILLIGALILRQKPASIKA